MSLLGRREWFGLALLALVAVGAWVTAPERALSALAALGDRPLLFAALLTAVYLVRPLVAWPTMAVSAAVGFVLGPTLGFVVASTGVAFTSLPAYLAARRFGAGSGLVARLGAGGRAYFRTAGGVRGVVAGRLAPVPADAVSVAAGLADVRPRAFLLGSVVGEIPWTATAVVVGASAREVTVGGLSAVGLPLFAAGALAAAALLAGPLYRRVARDSGA